MESFLKGKKKEWLKKWMVKKFTPKLQSNFNPPIPLVGIQIESFHTKLDSQTDRSACCKSWSPCLELDGLTDLILKLTDIV